MTDFSSEELAKRTHTHLNNYITTADQKASILITAQFAFLGFYSGGIGNIWSSTTFCFKLFSGLSIVTGLIAAVLAGWVIYPRSPQGEENGLMFWESISAKAQSDFVSDVNELSDPDALDELIKQNHSLAQAANSKYKFTRLTLLATAVSVGFASLSMGVYFL